MIQITSIDHIVVTASNLAQTIRFYANILDLEPREERPGKWALHFGEQKISLQEVSSLPDIAKRTTPGSANFCLLSESPLSEVIDRLVAHNVKIVEGPSQKTGATGAILSVYFHDPDGNLVEVSNTLEIADKV